MRGRLLPMLLAAGAVATALRAEVRIVVMPATGLQPEPAVTAPGVPAVTKTDTRASFRVLVPYFEVDGNDPGGITTLFAVRNRSSDTVHVTYTYYRPDYHDPPYTVQHGTLGPRQTRTVNVRDVAEIPPDPVTGMKTGYVMIEADAATLVGDYFRIDPTLDFASGDALVNPEAMTCKTWDSRFFNGGPFNGGTTFTFLMGGNFTLGLSPLLVGQVFDEAGTHRGTVQIYTSDFAFEVKTQDLPPAILGTFGTIEWSSPDGGLHMFVLNTYKANGRYAISLPGMCADPPGP